MNSSDIDINNPALQFILTPYALELIESTQRNPITRDDPKIQSLALLVGKKFDLNGEQKKLIAKHMLNESSGEEYFIFELVPA